jgi:hypothetical protein
MESSIMATKINGAKKDTEAKQKMKLIQKQAATDAEQIIQAGEQRNAANMTMLATALDRGRALRIPRATLFRDEKAGHIVGCHDLHLFYLGEFAGALTKRRGLKEADAYVKRIKSDFAALLSACQINSGTIAVRQRADDDGNREATVKIDDFATWAKSIPGSIEFTGREPFVRAVQAARLLRTTAGYVPGRAPRRAGVRTVISPAAVTEMLDRHVHGRAGPPGLMSMADWLAREFQAVIPQQMKREFQAATTVWRETLERAIAMAHATDVLAQSGLKPTAVKTPARIAPARATADA